MLSCLLTGSGQQAIAVSLTGIVDPMNTADPRVTLLVQYLNLADPSQTEVLLALVYLGVSRRKAAKDW